MSEAVWEKGLLIMPKYGARLKARFMKKSRAFRILGGFFLVSSLFAAIALYSKLPSMNGIETLAPVSSKILDRNGRLLYEVYGEYRRTPVPFEQISPYLKEATVAAEDKNFYSHGAVSIPSMARAAYQDYKQKSYAQGGSTISQQVIKNIFLTRSRSLSRKTKEAVLAFQLEFNFSKDEILRLYLNTVPYGRNAYGAEAAAQSYFGKPAKDLDLAESAYLAALPKAPSFYSPQANFQLLKTRQIYVLNTMQTLGYIKPDENKTAQNEKVVFKPPASAIAAPYFVKWIEQYLKTQYGQEALQTKGLVVYTSLDLDLQKQAEKIVADGVAKNGKKYGAHNAALVAMDPNNGQILAMVGGAGYFDAAYPPGCRPGITCEFDPQVNVAVAPRQPGSSFKPYTYVTAFSPQFGFAPASPILDERQNFAAPGMKPYVPHNFNGQSYGLIPMRKALAGSLNVPAVRTLSMIGVNNVVDTARTLGITTPLQNCGLSLTLGACEVKLIDHVAAFGAFANGGKKVAIHPILKIADKTGKILEDKTQARATAQVLDAEAVYELVNVLSDNDARSFIFGSHSPLILSNRPVAAKTGTSQDFKDGWTVGFTPQLVAGVWAGNNNGDLIKAGGDGVVVAAPIWHAFMEYALKDTPVAAFSKPNGIQEVMVSRHSGKLAADYTPDPVKEVFADYSVPTEVDTYRPPPATTTDESLIAMPDQNQNLSNNPTPPPPELKMPPIATASIGGAVPSQ